MGASAQGHFVTLPDGLQLHYKDISGQDTGNGEPVIFIHGSGPGASGHSNFKQNYPVFAEAGYRVIVPDRRATAPRTSPTPFTPWTSLSQP